MVIAPYNSFNGRSQRKQRNHSASSPATVHAKNSNSIDDCAIKVFFLDFYEMADSPMVMTKPPVDLHSSGFEYQLESDKSMITAGCPV